MLLSVLLISVVIGKKCDVSIADDLFARLLCLVYIVFLVLVSSSARLNLAF